MLVPWNVARIVPWNYLRTKDSYDTVGPGHNRYCRLRGLRGGRGWPKVNQRKPKGNQKGCWLVYSTEGGGMQLSMSLRGCATLRLTAPSSTCVP